VTDALFSEWQAYKKLVDNDYMYHSEFFGCLAEEISKRFDQPVDILDIGCGDAAPLKKWLSRVDINHYTGIDEAVNALAQAEENLLSTGIPHRLYPGELTDVLPGIDDRFDIIIMSFFLHHFESPERKTMVLEQCRKRLKPNGFVAIVDVVNEPGESREHYLGRCDKRIRSVYKTLNPEEIDILLTHIWKLDFPESLSSYKQIGNQAGYGDVRSLMLDRTGMHGLITFTQ